MWSGWSLTRSLPGICGRLEIVKGARNRFEWDAKKAAVNLKKHGVQFESAIAVFDDALAVTVPDPDHSEEEERWITVGHVGDLLLVIVHTWQDLDVNSARVRIISARRATRAEAAAYEESL